MDYLSKAKRVLALEIAELQRLHDRVGASFELAIELLKSTIDRNGKIIVAGVGKSGNIGQKMVATFNSTGSASVALNCQDALHGDLGILTESDIVIALSYTGETVELLNLLPHIKRRDIPLIAITGKSQSSLAKYADCVLNIEVEREACPHNLAPTSSTTNTLAIGDALAMVLLEARGFEKEHYAALHPGGSLGHMLLSRASDIMRSGESLVTVSPELSIAETLGKMTAARNGAAVIVDADSGKLAGIFTHADFSRAFQASPQDIASHPVKDYMTADPISVVDDQLAGEVLKQLENYRIDDLVVVDKDQIPVGIIDTQDLTRLKVV